MIYPEAYKTDEERYKFVCKAREEARLLYNIVSRWADTGITRAEYDSLPKAIKAIATLEQGKEQGKELLRRVHILLNNLAEELCTHRGLLERAYAKLDTIVNFDEVTDAFREPE